MPAAEAIRDSPDTIVDFARLERSLEVFRAEYDKALPWRHLVIDGFLNPVAARRAANAFPRIAPIQSALSTWLEARWHESSIDEVGELISELIAELNGSRFRRWLSSVTAIEGLIADNELIGAGLHQGARGSYLRIHADHNTHPTDPTRYRRVNLLLYLNEGWEPRWNGDLELWDRDARSCRKRIAPILNRCVIALVNDTAFHGYPRLRLPRNVTRKAIVAYYYANSPAAGQSASPHLTLLPRLQREHLLSYLSHGIRRMALNRVQRIVSSAARRRLVKEATTLSNVKLDAHRNGGRRRAKVSTVP